MRKRECCNSNFAIFWESFDFLNRFNYGRKLYFDEKIFYSALFASIVLIGYNRK